MLNHAASLAISASVLKALPGKLAIKRHSPSIASILYFFSSDCLLIISYFLCFITVCNIDLIHAYVRKPPHKLNNFVF